MVNVRIEGDTIVFDVQGLHQLWAFKTRLDIPRASVPGTHVPGLLTAGTFYIGGDRNFWDVHDAANAVVVDLDDQDYSQLVIEVEDPAAVVRMLTEAAN